MSNFIIAFVPGVLAGMAFWAAFIRPRQLNKFERKRRACGLPPKRQLPEDDS